MNLNEFEEIFRALPENYKTGDIDIINKRLIKEKTDVSFLRPLLPEHEEYYRTFFAVGIAEKKTKEEKTRFIEDNLVLLHDWWHVDSIVSFLGDSLDFDYALQKAREYIKSELPYTRRLGYVLFIPRLVKDTEKIPLLFPLFKNDCVYHVRMAEAWLLSFLAMHAPEKTYLFLKDCELKYDIVGKAIQKICDSHVIPRETKERFKALRAARKIIF